MSAAFSLGSECLLAVRADAEKFEFVRHGLEAVCRRDAFLDFAGETFLNFNDLRAFGADQMMMMAVVAGANQFKPGGTVAEIKPLHHPHFFEQMHGPVNGRQIAPTFGQGG